MTEKLVRDKLSMQLIKDEGMVTDKVYIEPRASVELLPGYSVGFRVGITWK
jgi:hypothetical protein